jgi:acyl transferase domain-containing protein
VWNGHTELTGEGRGEPCVRPENGQNQEEIQMNHNENNQPEPPENTENLEGAAIIGMAGRFPNAKNIDEFWQNLENGIDCITFYENEELIKAGCDPGALENPDYVKAKGAVEDVDMFDASFFGINPREAEVTDPQHRMLLECAQEAMEHAGYDSSKFDGAIGVFAGKSMDYYLLLNVFPRIRKELSAGSLQAAIGNDKDSLTTTISYRLNLTGPAITIQTSSSTSLVSVCVAAQSLLTYQCDIAMAGGITAGPPIKSGYLYQEGNIWAPDGHCRPFDSRAKGFVSGSGMGLVVLKRLDEAILDGDNIWAVIKGFAVNNDGYNKVSYSAPSVDAQARVVTEALAVADVHPETIQYIETHGTGTNLGDPIEITALNQAFQAQTTRKHYCAIGSVKGNIGHLDTAAGIAGLIKVALSLEHKKIPASLHFENPNPKIDFENSPFFVNTGLREWKVNTRADGVSIPRRAAVTSLGMGGTNAHVVLEEWPDSHSSNAWSREQGAGSKGRGGSPCPPSNSRQSSNSRQYQLILLSAKTETAMDEMTKNLANHLKVNPGLTLADAAYTLKVGRRDFNYRRMVLCQELEDAKTALEELTPGPVLDSVCDTVERSVVFMFSGQGAQYVNMANELYQKEPVFRKEMDRCFEILTPYIGYDIKEILYPHPDCRGGSPYPPQDCVGSPLQSDQINQTEITQPVLFMLEYSLAQLWMDWGIVPKGMIGHSIGEFVAACISGCLSLEDALKLVTTRGRLMHQQEKGAMLSVGIDESSLEIMLNDHLSLAAVNSPKHCVVSGKTHEVEKLEKQLTGKKIFCRRLHTSHAFHSAMMGPIIKEFTEAVTKVEFKPPNIPFISGVTGTWIRKEEVNNPLYWAQQLRKTVRFSDGIREILKDPSRVLLEVGPGSSLCVLAKEHQIIVNETESQPVTFSSLRHIKQTEPDMSFLLKTLGNLWLSGAAVDWKSYYKNEKRRRIPLPAYPFERKRYWLEEIKGIKQDIEEKTGREEVPAGETPDNIPAETETNKAEGEKEKTFQPRPKLSSEYAAPTNELEQQIVEMWEDILGIKPIGINDNFFDLGGHSLLATLFLSQVLEKFQIRLELQSIFESPTIATIARLVKAEQNKAANLEDVENILTEIEGLSQDEIREAISGEKPEEME